MCVFERLTDRARKVFALANQEAQRFNHEYIGTEHILLGLVREGTGGGATALKDLGISLEQIRGDVEYLATTGPDMVTLGKLPQSPRAKAVIELAINECRSLGHSYIGTEHLLLGLIGEKEGIAAQVLGKLGVSLERTREAVVELAKTREAREAKAADDAVTMVGNVERRLMAFRHRSRTSSSRFGGSAISSRSARPDRVVGATLIHHVKHRDQDSHATDDHRRVVGATRGFLAPYAGSVGHAPSSRRGQLGEATGGCVVCRVDPNGAAVPGNRLVASSEILQGLADAVLHAGVARPRLLDDAEILEDPVPVAHGHPARGALLAQFGADAQHFDLETDRVGKSQVAPPSVASGTLNMITSG